MEERLDEGKRIDDPEEGDSRKRPYSAPKLTRHGDVQTITRQHNGLGFFKGGAQPLGLPGDAS